MKDYGVSVLEQYDIDVTETKRVRNGVVAADGETLYLLREMRMIPERMEFLMKVYNLLEESQIVPVDTPIANKEGEYLTKADDGTTYLLKKWFVGKECDIKKEAELVEGAKVLAQIHRVMKLPEEERTSKAAPEPETLIEEYERHNRELRKIHTFVRKRSVKNAFESEFLKEYDTMYAQAQEALEKMKRQEYGGLYENESAFCEISHGDYNYHNLLFCQRGTAVTNFEHSHIEIQLSDFYYYLRKVLEKHHYDERLGYRMLRAYDSVNTLGKEKRDYLKVRLSYPEKFWKIANTYYHSNKAWIPGKNVEKLKLSCAQRTEKEKFLQNLFG